MSNEPSEFVKIVGNEPLINKIIDKMGCCAFLWQIKDLKFIGVNIKKLLSLISNSYLMI
jgi:hypothetical protein